MALVASNVEAGYAGADVLRAVSCAASPGVVTAIVGPNGAGKTTLLRVLLGAIRPRRGSVTLDGASLGAIPLRDRSERLAFIPQTCTPELSYSVIEVVRLGRLRRREPAGESLAAARRALDLVGLGERGEEPVGTLSAGQQQRVLVARALSQLGAGGGPAADPGANGGPGRESGGRAGRYLLADEPVASMDPRHALASMELLRDAARGGVGVVVVLHDFALAARYADRVILLAEAGQVAAEGPAALVLTPEVLGPVFGVSLVSARAGGSEFPVPEGPAAP